ncbi:hypothetical protein LUZ60_010912 [Juncus effusus]|nr:hypothetical protein LUZ60_010912 [Juncus effusus]
MVMDAGIHDLITIPNEFKYFPPISPQNSQSSISSNDFFVSQDLINPTPMAAHQNGFFDPTHFIQTQNSNPSSLIQTPLMNPNTQLDSPEDPLIFSDITLNFISRMLMEEDIDEKFEQYPENPNPELLAEAEKPFLEILGSNLSISNSIPSPNQPPLPSPNSSDEESFANSLLNYDLIGNNSDNSFDLNEFFALNANLNPVLTAYSPQSSFSSPNSLSNNNNNNIVDVLDQFDELKNQPVSQFQKGVEEASKFLPNEEKLIIDLESHEFLNPSPKPLQLKPLQIKPIEIKEEEIQNPTNHKGKKHFHESDFEENRSNKHSAGNPEELAREMLDKVLLCNGETCSKGVKELRESLQNTTAKNHSKTLNPKGRRIRQPKKDVVDLRTLLSHCAQAVATDDRKSAFELLKQLRQHSSEKGDANQRLAHYFADGLEARLAGTGSQIYQSFTMKKIASTDILKAYQLYLAASPFKKISHFFSNQTILDAAERAKTVHIIDYGIYYGFQWPCLIQRLSKMPNGPPKLRITGIDLPQPGFRPAERIEETGLRLKDYAKTFNVPFEYKAIAARWESIKIEELDIKQDELLVVNSLYRFKTLIDESVLVESPRDIVLSTIKKMNPDVFIHGVVNGSYNAPFFVTRFREAMFHFSSLFDMLETNVPKEDESRQLLEKALFGREAINVISCEGVERVERPESYKQWQVRNLRAGFKQLPLNEGIMKKAKEKVRNCYHKDFIIDEDNRWLLQGWKGRIVFALSTWRPSQRGH